MNPLTAQQIAEILGTQVAAGNPGVLASGGVSTDTRTLSGGAVFFALRGGNFDGDAFAKAALEKGAAVAVVHRWEGDAPANAAVIVVSDTLLALQKLAHWWRKQLELPVVCITGSNGKTSTKDFTAAVLSRKFNVSATRGNLNNHIGVPLTVLAATPQHTAAVWEIGMNHSGELAPLCEIARPKYGIITNIGTAHIEHLGSRDAIAEEKGTLARALPADGFLCIPATCDYHEYLRQRTKAHLVSVGNGRGLVRAEDLRFEADRTVFNLVIEGEGGAEVTLPVPGKHMVTNALLAAAIGWKLGVPVAEIAAGLSGATLTGSRLGRRDWNGVTVIDDTYNANPESMAAAIETVAEMPLVNGARRYAVLGRMGELGPLAPSAHLRAGELAAERGLTVVAVGEGAEGIAAGAGNAPHFPDLGDAAAWLSREVKPGDVVLFKGSRAATVEKVMNTAFPNH
ncbi:MAG: UDP-N-acetylmuramoyl-tripeptide--D-alanyl-D-alanine ligase [Verrucomicrobiaceae bacterium]|nr:MAG: UDP-N-acetylmuramoyl-tripeptide--D-alanyl-D-alanine ligase [Verrucomicrobiaceae bacterium]